ncbi:MAG: sulfate ABC transporter substrate-binding protein [Verrucomicrobiae bacterium]|nr:sulfate ABC transporter substrate-binding protein [Verrucomicrobiae bacterium]
MNIHRKARRWCAGLVAASWGFWASAAEPREILNVSFDISRELYEEINRSFVAHHAQTTGRRVAVRQSHGGSTRQARAVLDGLRADVVTLNQITDVEALVDRGGLISADWRNRWPHGSVPYASTIVFLVRKGNPRGIRDWDDLARAGLQVIVPNPKTSGNGRYSYLAAYAHALRRLGLDEAGARDFVARIFANVPILDTGGRGATATFVQREIGDVLLTFEAEVHLTLRELGGARVDMVRPCTSVLAEMPVALVEGVVARKGTERLARAYLEYLFSEPAQEIMARHFYRPSDAGVRQRHAASFGEMELFRVEDALGPWSKVNATHFGSGGIFDSIYERHRRP